METKRFTIDVTGIKTEQITSALNICAFSCSFTDVTLLGDKLFVEVRDNEEFARTTLTSVLKGY